MNKHLQSILDFIQEAKSLPDDQKHAIAKSLKDVDKESVFEQVPAYVYLTQERFAICPLCNRVYWHGTHADRMLKQIPLP